MTAFPVDIALAIKIGMVWINEETREFCLFAPHHPAVLPVQVWRDLEWFGQRVITLMIAYGYHPVKPLLDLNERLN